MRIVLIEKLENCPLCGGELSHDEYDFQFCRKCDTEPCTASWNPRPGAIPMKKAEHLMKYDRDGNVRCRVCGCTEVEACNPPCSWREPDLCSACAVTAFVLREWKQGAHQPNMAALMREVSR